jgi:prepilin-type N-terminal cleavage/methylation domain-containing protein
MKTQHQPTRGFTLVEIMIVVAIIGMLATIALPNFVKARTDAQRTACIQNLRIIDGAIQQWALEQRKDAGQAVAFSDISAYMKNAVVCPAGGTSFQDSYTISTVEDRPVCSRKPDSHKLPL